MPKSKQEMLESLKTGRATTKMSIEECTKILQQDTINAKELVRMSKGLLPTGAYKDIYSRLETA